MTFAPPLSRAGRFLFSLDLEMAWGMYDRGALPRYADAIRQEPEIVRWLLKEMDEHGIRGTWAIVGRLMMRPEDPTEDERVADSWAFPHQPPPRRTDPLWYAPDLVDAIARASVGHEIATHTFSHVDTDRAECTRDVFRSEIAACKAVHERRGLRCDSIVFPRNHVRHLDVLRELGVRSYRGRATHAYERLGPRAGRALTFATRLMGARPPTYPLPDAFVREPVNLPASMFLYPREGSRRFIPSAARDRQALAAVEAAATKGEIAHLWLHPYNLATDPSLRDTCHRVFAAAARYMERGELVADTMAGLSTRIAAAA